MNMRNFSFQSILTRLCAGGMALLGFGCDGDYPGGGGDMYGTPVGTFEIKGKVVTEDGKEVAGAAVRVTQPDFPSGVFSYAEVKTGDNGTYISTGNEFLGNKTKVVCVPDDPALEADSVIIDVKYTGKNNKNNPWDIGQANATVDFTLKKKESGK